MSALARMPDRLRGRGLQTALLVALMVAVVGQFVVLYLPRPPAGIPLFPHADKVIHVGIFAIPALLAVLVGRATIMIPFLVVHAPTSEVIQGLFLPERGMDLFDIVADLGGIGVGWWLGSLVVRALSGR